VLGECPLADFGNCGGLIGTTIQVEDYENQNWKTKCITKKKAISYRERKMKPSRPSSDLGHHSQAATPRRMACGPTTSNFSHSGQSEYLVIPKL
jgi:hypothetical protein